MQIVDLTKNSPKEVIDTLVDETKNGFLLHGSHNPEILTSLDPRPARDVLRESGRKNAIYATTNVESAIHRAIVNTKYLKEKFGNSYVIGWAFRKNGQMIFKASPNVYQLLLTDYDSVFDDGHIYSFPRDTFERNVGQEYVSHVSQTPTRVFKIPGATAKQIFVIGDTIEQYSKEELDSFNIGF